MRLRPAIACLALLGAGCTHRQPAFPAPIPAVPGSPVTAFSLRYIDISQGAGALAEPRKCYYADYTGWLTDGKEFDSSHDTTAQGKPRDPITFPQGAHRVITGWDVGFEGMHVGGARRLIIPYQLAYGERGRPPVIPERATLVFDVHLLAQADTLPRTDAAPAARGAPPRCPPWSSVGAGIAR
ncbi:MAG TPA: FKBP-type peptidyl-prolyl cis-trans isomerase [Gemmatimonadaceae bacterium]|nr:FKBP-type peptidyl-prolyl cis-trans isomerase [Gemmatimonadaceae bacterium]